MLTKGSASSSSPSSVEVKSRAPTTTGKKTCSKRKRSNDNNKKTQGGKRKSTRGNNKGGPTCYVCKSSEKKAAYKCPRCRVPYCGIACYRAHKDDQSEMCAAAEKRRKSDEIDARETLKRKKMSFLQNVIRGHVPGAKKRYGRREEADEGEEDKRWHLSEETLEKLRRSDAVRDLLRRSSLRASLQRITEESSRVKRKAAVVCALENEPFREFADRALEAMGFLEKDGRGVRFVMPT